MYWFVGSEAYSLANITGHSFWVLSFRDFDCHNSQDSNKKSTTQQWTLFYFHLFRVNVIFKSKHKLNLWYSLSLLFACSFSGIVNFNGLSYGLPLCDFSNEWSLPMKLGVRYSSSYSNNISLTQYIIVWNNASCERLIVIYPFSKWEKYLTGPVMTGWETNLW